jgi:hypothetical protein
MLLRSRTVSLASLAALTLIAGCSGGAPVVPGAQTFVPQTPLAAVKSCPARGALETTGKASSRVGLATAIAGGKAIQIKWTVAFKDLTPAQLQNRPVFKAKLHACGMSSTPLGTLGGKSSTKRGKGTCTAGKCTVTDVYVRTFTPPKTIPGTAFKYDIVDFRPRVPQRPYKYLKGVLVLIKK